MNINASPDRTSKKPSREESFTGKTTMFLPMKVPHINPKTMGLEYRQDVTNDTQYINRIFETNLYEPNYEGLVEFYSDVYYIMDTKESSDKRNFGTVFGMASLGILGFAAFGITFIGGLAGIIFGGTLGRLIAGKIADMRRKKETVTQEDLYLLKAKCMVELGTKQKKKAKNDLNKFRLGLERIIEESSLTLEMSLFAKPKLVNDIRFQLRNLLMDEQTQVAVQLSYRLFKSFMERTDMTKPENLERAARKVYGVFIPYVKIIELLEIPPHARDHPSLVAYYKLKDFIAKPEITEILEKFPEYVITQERLDDFKAFLKQEVNIAEPMKRAMARNRHSVTEHLPLKRPSRGSKSYGDNHNIEVPDKAASNIDDESIVSCPSMKNFAYEDLGEGVTAYNADLYTSGALKKGFTPVPSHNNLAAAAAAPKDVVIDIKGHDDNHLSQHAWNKMPSMHKSTLAKPKHRGDNDEGVSESPSKRNTRIEETKVDPQSEQARAYVPLAKSNENSQTQQVEDRSQLISLARSDQIDSPIRKQQSIVQTPKNQSSPMNKQKSQEGNAAFDGNSLGPNVQNKVIFDRVLSIAYDNVSKWDKVINNPTIRIDKIKPEGSSVVLIRAWALIPGFSPMEVYDQIYDANKRSKWDTVTTNMSIVEQIDECTSVIHFVIKAPPTITDRDFVQRRIFSFDYPEKGSIILGFQSFAHPKMPPVKNRIRGETHIAGYILKPSEKDPNSTDLCLITQVDIKGSIPKILVNMAAGKSPAEWVNKLIKACEKARLDKK